LKRVKDFPKRDERLTSAMRSSGQPPRVKLTREEVIKRMESFPKRREKFIAAIRESAD
jgi:hypothetical protein